MMLAHALRFTASRLGQALDRWAERVWAWDEATTDAVSSSRLLQRFDLLLVVATYLGYGYLWGALAVALLVFGTKADHANVLIGTGVVILSVFLSQAMKSVGGRPRPQFHRRGFHHQFLTNASFPSNHTAAAFAMAYLVLRLYPWWPNVVVIYSMATLIGLSRVYLREHFPLDVVGGAVLGTWVSHGLLPLFARLVQ
ncbi:MAG TPA: phosphatase PAP2 family protein [Candidatus Acetothermia bacterium]|nr:phosphatase PAP2 family protein [Candidatus Acetothermia bacterium]